MAAYAYVRVSTDRQADKGESLGTQKRQIEGYAMMIGVTLDRVYVERGVSGSKPFGERQEGARLLEACQPGDAVISST
jgi:putative DNA-invertase from lambdoid prophage Rac